MSSKNPKTIEFKTMKAMQCTNEPHRKGTREMRVPASAVTATKHQHKPTKNDEGTTRQREPPTGPEAGPGWGGESNH